ncbi:hypothetical protein C8J56DRAFT_154276 [Mycena floridula]|nr:hypothetical protein C8J56DRAFT_154276 [Mycena floridula]
MRFSSQISTSDVFIITILLFSPLVTSIATVTKQQAIDATLTNVTVSQINSTSPIPVQRKQSSHSCPSHMPRLAPKALLNLSRNTKSSRLLR